MMPLEAMFSSIIIWNFYCFDFFSILLADSISMQRRMFMCRKKHPSDEDTTLQSKRFESE